MRILIWLVLIVTAGLPRGATAAEWIVAKVNQPAHYTTDRETWTALETGMAVPDASWIKTGKGGRLLLRRDQDTILLKPGSKASIAAHGSGGRKTTIRQRFGRLLFDVETRDEIHTRVKTPMIAGVVKGTRFEVASAQISASIAVERGMVAVVDRQRLEMADIRSGQSATVSAVGERSMKMAGKGEMPRIVRLRLTRDGVIVRGKPVERKRGETAELLRFAATGASSGTDGPVFDSSSAQTAGTAREAAQPLRLEPTHPERGTGRRSRSHGRGGAAPDKEQAVEQIRLAASGSSADRSGGYYDEPDGESGSNGQMFLIIAGLTLLVGGLIALIFVSLMSSGFNDDGRAGGQSGGRGSY